MSRMVGVRVRHVYEREDMRRLFEGARERDLDNGGVFDVRSTRINVWSEPWTTYEKKRDSVIAMSFDFDWFAVALMKIESISGTHPDEPYFLLGEWERGALGFLVHGKDRGSVTREEGSEKEKSFSRNDATSGTTNCIDAKKRS